MESDDVAKVIASILAMPTLVPLTLSQKEREQESFEKLRRHRGDQWIVDNQEFLKKNLRFARTFYRPE
jgi:hypothetical protein